MASLFSSESGRMFRRLGSELGSRLGSGLGSRDCFNWVVCILFPEVLLQDRLFSSRQPFVSCYTVEYVIHRITNMLEYLEKAAQALFTETRTAL